MANLAISNCSAYVKSCNSSGISPTQRLFARARVGIFFLSRDSAHMGQTLLQPGANMGPFNSLTGSVLLHLAFLVTPSTFSKLTFQFQKALPFHKLELIPTNRTTTLFKYLWRSI